MRKVFLMIGIAIFVASCTKVAEITIIPDTTLEEDLAVLDEQMAKIKEMAESEVCEDADEWKFTAVGNTCCNAEVYMAYSIKIDEKEFFDKIEIYNRNQKEINIKWDLLEICNLIDCKSEPKPKTISCVEGKAILNYINDNTTLEEDRILLEDLFAQIKAMAESEVCENANDWKFTAYGSKACGGPIGYIAYSINIEENIFLEKIKTYTEAENEYNIKHGIASTCDIAPAPKSVNCEDGKAILNY